MHSFTELLSFFRKNGLNVIAVQTTKSQLKRGDLVQVKNTDSAFLVYIGKDTKGDILIEDLHNQFSATPNVFDKLFTGNAILINHSATPRVDIVNTDAVKDSPIYDPTIHETFIKKGYSVSQQIREEWKNAYQRQDFIDRATKLINSATTAYGKCQAIFTYIRDAYAWHKHYDTQWSVGKVVSTKKGNCCELSRMIICLTHSVNAQLGVRHRFAHADGHVWAQFLLNKDWIHADASNNANAFGQHVGGNPFEYFETTDLPL